MGRLKKYKRFSIQLYTLAFKNMNENTNHNNNQKQKKMNLHIFTFFYIQKKKVLDSRKLSTSSFRWTDMF